MSNQSGLVDLLASGLVSVGAIKANMERKCSEIESLREINADLLAALRAAASYVELYTGNGVIKQPPARYIKPNGVYDVELIAADARAAIAKAEGKS
jgi:hypothetical protein